MQMASNAMPGLHASWHDQRNDNEQRQALVHNIFNLFARRKPDVNQDWQRKLPDFIKRLEEALYRLARSRDEYSDLSTLEHRLQQVARKMVNKPGQPVQNSDPALSATGSGGTQVSSHMPPQQAQHAQQQQLPHQQLPQQQQQQNGYAMPLSAPLSSQQQANEWWSGSGGGETTAYTSTALMPLMPAQTLHSFGSLPKMQQSPVMNGNCSSVGASSPNSQPGVNGFRQQQHHHLPLHQQPLHQQQQQQQQLQPVGSVMLVKQEGVGINDMMPLKVEGGGYEGCAPPVKQEGGGMMAPHQYHPGQPHQQNHLGMASHGIQGGDGMRTGPSGQAPGSHLMSNGVPVLRGTRAAASQHAWPTTMPHLLTNSGLQRMNSMVPSSAGLQPVQADSHQPFHHSPQMNGGGGAINGHAGVSSAMPGGMVPVSSIYSGPMAGSIGPPGLPVAAASPSSELDHMPGIGDLPSGSTPFKGNVVCSERLPSTQDPPQVVAAKKNYIAKQQRWLLFLRHCAKCQAVEHACQYGDSCTVAKRLWRHILTCSGQQCPYPRCVASRELLKHHQKCSSTSCPVCTPVKQYVLRQRQAINHRTAQASQQQHQVDGVAGNYASASTAQHSQLVNNDCGANGSSLPAAGIVPMVEPPAKRQKAFDPRENAGTSLLEAFGMKELTQHIDSLESGSFRQNSEFSFPDDSVCKACGQNRLTFEPPSLYCTCCGQRIKRNQVFYSPQVRQAVRASEVKGHWCHACVSETKETGLQQIDGSIIKKCDMQKKKNDEEMEEGWVQCDNCEGWVHQICGLFNKGRNDEDMPYQCPACLKAGLQKGQRKPIVARPQSMLEARDLPSCDLSRHLQTRLDSAVAAEQSARAAALGVPPESVKGAEGLTVRVVNNVDKVQEVKANFQDAFKTDGFPASLPYRQKVILLFQRMEGVDVCLYCVYTQEYGDTCPGPNTRWVYLAYIDSVKYFTPEQAASAPQGSGAVSCALRTLVYHELLLAYLEYVKARGFTSMFIWACPPLQGDDYILYCHPNRQKTPRSDRLREWYHALLRTAKERGTVTYVSNLFDTFFPGGKDHRLPKPSAAHLPYLEGDYWPGEAENLLTTIAEEHRQAGKRAKGSGTSGAAKPVFAPRSKGSAKGKRSAVAGSVDEALLGKLGDVVQGMKDDFMVVHFRESCSYCRKYLSDEGRYRHPNPPLRTVRQERTFEGISLETPGASSRAVLAMSRFQLCIDCLRSAEAAASQAGGASSPAALPAGIRLADLVMDHVEAIPATSDGGNPDMESEFFDTRQAFLSLCQGNHYQFDTMRRAKHSSMMVLYHLHNPQAPAFSCTCNTCGQEVAPGEGWRCTVCTDYDLCSSCASRGTALHPHRLTQHPRKINETQQRITEDERRDRAAQLQRTMKLLVHASGCRDPKCVSSNCRKIKELYGHSKSCTVKVLNGCTKCRRMWALLQLHAKGCNESNCPVPRCCELRAMRRKQAVRQDDQRRTAYKAMLRKQNDTPGAH